MSQKQPTSSNLFSSSSPWKDGIEPVFQTGQFAIAQQQQLGMISNLNRYYQQQVPQYNNNNQLLQPPLPPQLTQQRGSFQSQFSSIDKPVNTSMMQPSNKGEKRTSSFREQFQQIFTQEQENVQPPTGRSNQSGNDGSTKRQTQAFQIEAAKVVVGIQNNLMGIIQGIQKNIVQSVNSNVNHQLKKQRYMMKKRHEEMLSYISDQEIIRGAKFHKAHSPSAAQMKHGSANRPERSSSAAVSNVNQREEKEVEAFKPAAAGRDIQLTGIQVNDQNREDFMKIKGIQRVKEYTGGESDQNAASSNSQRNAQANQAHSSTNIQPGQASNRNNNAATLNANKSNNAPSSSAFTKYENSTIKGGEAFQGERRNSQDKGAVAQATIKNNNGKRGSVGNSNTSLNQSSNNNNNNNSNNSHNSNIINNQSNDNLYSANQQTTLSKKYEQLFESTQQDGLQQSALKNEFLDDGASLAYTLDDEISKASVFFGNSVAFDQSRVRMSKNNSNVLTQNQYQNQQQQQNKQKFDEVEEVDLDEFDNLDWEKKSKPISSKGPAPSSTYNSQLDPYSKNSKISERSPVSDKYDDERFEELLDEDEMIDAFAPSNKQGGRVDVQKNTLNYQNSKNTKSSQPEAPAKQHKQGKQNEEDEIDIGDDDDVYNYKSDEFDLDDF